MAKNKNEKLTPNFVLGKDWFDGKRLPWSGKRATVFAIYYSFPSNQNASGSTGTNTIVQKIIPWGENAEPRVYISPYALKRRIRDYWIKANKGDEDKVFIREDSSLIEEEGKLKEMIKEYIDVDLFGYMKASKGSNEAATTRPGPITTWGAVSIESLHTFVDFNTSLINPSKDDSGGMFNRYISKEFYFTSFHINPDLIGISMDMNSNNKEEIINRKKRRLKKFFEALRYAIQKDSGGARDKPSCVLMGIAIEDHAYSDIDKKVFNSIKIKDDRIYKIKTDGFKVLHFEKEYFSEEVSFPTKDIDDVIKELTQGESNG